MPSRLTVPVPVPVRVTAPTDALHCVFVIALAVRVGAALTVKVIDETALVHVPRPVAVSVTIIAPVVVGVKVGFNALALLNVPPVLVQVIVE